MNEAIRSFVAVDISDDARRQIAGLLGGLRHEPTPAVRWVRPELMHLTLAFLGEVSQEFLESAKGPLAEAARRHEVFVVQLKGLGAFPSPRRARVVWIGTGQGRGEVCALQADIANVLSSVGYQPERRPFSPHLTIGRLRAPANVERVVADSFESKPFRVGSVLLFRSVLGPGGPTYTPLSEFSLQKA
jgi:2'-5' RNA ligase